MIQEILFNKIIWRKSTIKIDSVSLSPTVSIFTVYYKNTQVGYYTSGKISVATQVFRLYLFGREYNSDPIIMPASTTVINSIFKAFLAKLGLTLNEQ